MAAYDAAFGATKPETLRRARLALILAGVLWSLGGLLIKTLTHHPAWSASALGITCYRSLFAGLCLLPLVRGRVMPRLADSLWAILIYILLLALYIASMQGTTAANAIFLQYTAPLYALALGPLFFGEPFRKADLWSLLLAMVGIVVLFLGSFHGGERLPLMMGAGSGLMFGLFLLWLRRLRYADPIAVTTVNNFGVALLAGLGAWLAPRPFGGGSTELTLLPRLFAGDRSLLPVALLLILMGVVQFAIPYVLFSYGLRHAPAVEGGLLALVEPVLTPFWVLVGLHEQPSASTVIGGAIILAALASRYTLFRERGARADAPPPA